MLNLPKISPPYKNEQNRWYLEALFYDRVILRPIEARNFTPPFILNEDKAGFINCRKTFVELNDPTGYKWAMKYLGDYAHWKKLVNCTWFNEALQGWLEELRIKLQSEAIDTIKAISLSPDKQALVAAKYLAEYSWEKRAPVRGRPSKAEVRGELKRAVDAMSVEDEDLKRIGLVK